MSTQLQDFFRTCDRDGSRYVDRDAFRDLCTRLNISGPDADLIFEDLDVDKDGKISFADFSKGFSTFLSEAQSESQQSKENIKNCVWTTLTTEAEKVGNKSSDEGKLKWLLSQLQSSEQRHLVPLLEAAVEELLCSLRQLEDEKAKLEESWHREKAEHQRHLKRMEEELDSQVKEVEMKMRLKAQEDVEDERKSLQSKMDTELNKLAAIEKVFTWFRTQQPSEAPRDPRLDEVRTKLNEAVYDNHQLRMSLLDTQTNISLMRSELLQLRTLYEEKCRELSSEKEKILEVLQEQDHLSRQLDLLHDANRRLLDSHDALRSTMEISTKQVKPPRKKSGSIIGDYLERSHSRECLERFPEDEEEDEDNVSLRRAQSMDVSFPVKRRIKSKHSHSARHSLNHSDSGVSTVRSSFEPDDTWEDVSQREETSPTTDETDLDRRQGSRRGSRASRTSSVPPAEDRSFRRCSRVLRPSTSEDSLLETGEAFPRRTISDIKKQLGIEDEPANWRRSWSPQQCSSPDTQMKGKPPTPLPRMSKVGIGTKSKVQGDDSSLLAASVEVDESEFEPDGPPTDTYKVIFVGDAGVGKSSFALRISKGVFVRHMSSTLGLDFLMRTLRVDGRNVGVQLWDTAGQERFRSITKSYFRKADGVMLLYDCTCEHSFLSVRHWVEDIDVISFYSMMATKSTPGSNEAFHRIPLMIVANKTDLREAAIKAGQTCVTTEQGETLAKACDTIFMEASAKDGSNVLAALASLIRCMSTRHQELRLSESAMVLQEEKSKKGGCCRK